MKIYLKGQETTDSYDKFDHELCGEDTKTSSVVSDGPRLVMIFSSGELQGRGFKAQYIFETGKLFDLESSHKSILHKHNNIPLPFF